jgi:hypothetical protein
VAAGCGAGSERPGAELRTPGALAAFYGFVASKDGLRHLLAVANERGDELRLIDLADDSVIESPGLVYPLSVPTTGRPLLLAAASLNDVGGGLPDALAVIAAGSNELQIVDTWSGVPTVVATVTLPLPDAEVLSMASAAAPVSSLVGTAAPGIGRILVGLSGGRLEVLDFQRGAGNEVAAPVVTELTGLGFDPVSLSQGADKRYVYSASRDALPGGVLGVAKIALPVGLVGGSAVPAVTSIDALVQTEAVAVATFDQWAPMIGTTTYTFPPAGGGAYVDEFATNAMERLIAIPVASECGEPPKKKVRCGLLALNPTTKALEVDPLGEGPTLIPIALPAPVSGLLASGRSAANQVPIVSAGGAITINTTGVAAITTTDGNLYLVDIGRWAMASDTSPLVGTGRTRVTGAPATVVDAKSSAIGLWSLADPSDKTPTLSAKVADIPARVRVTPGFTPDDNWTLTSQVLPGLDARGARLGQDAGGFWLSVQVGATPPITSIVNLASPDVLVGETVTLEQTETGIACANGVGFTITGFNTLDPTNRPGGAVSLADTGGCLADVNSGLDIGANISAVATFHGLVLTGEKYGDAGRPTAFVPTAATVEAKAYELATSEFKVLDPAAVPPPPQLHRLFYVTDPCAGSECAGIWKSAPYIDITDPANGTNIVHNALDFPLPKGPLLGIVPGFVDAKGLRTTVPPKAGTALHFTTRSGLVVPSARRPIVSGAAISSVLPLGLALVDPGSGGVQLLVSYAAGLLADYKSNVAPGTMTVVR